MKITKPQKRIIIAFILVFSFFNVYTRIAERIVHFGILEYAIVLFDVCLLTFLLSKSICFAIEKLPALFRQICQDGFGVLSSGRGDETAQGNRHKGLPGSNLSDGAYYAVTLLILLLLWIPVFLAYYPGIFAYDIIPQLRQWDTGYTTHHPLLYTLYLQYFYYIIPLKLSWNPNVGIACAMLLQMLCFAASLSYAHLYFRRIRMPFILRCVLTAATGLLPFFSMLAISTTKDTFFSGFICIFVTAAAYEEGFSDRSPGLLNRVLLVLSAAGIILMRNNGLYPLAAFCLVLAIFSLKRKNYILLLLTLAGIAAGLCTNGALKSRLHAATVSVDEVLGIPYQQMACAYKDHEPVMSEEDKAAILTYLPDAAKYDPYNVDILKYTSDVQGDVKGFVRLYLRIGLRYPDSYLKGLCKADAGYICLPDPTFTRIYGTDNRQGYLLSDTKPGFDIEHKSLFPLLERLYEKLYTDNEFLFIMGLHMLCHPAFYFWILWAMLGYALIMKKKEAALLLVFTYTLIATILAGPCALIRYALAYIVIVPVLGGVLFLSGKSGVEGQA